MSLRNVYFFEEERKFVIVLYRVLNLVKEMIEKGEKDVLSIKRVMEEMILKEKYIKIDYIEFVNNEMFEIILKVEGKVLIVFVVFVGKVRFIDNIVVEVK